MVRRLLWLLFFAPMLLMPIPVGGYQCANEPMVEIAGDPQPLFREICRAAEKSIRFLGHFGLDPQHPIHLLIVDRAIASQGYDAYGSYDSRTDLVRLMSYRAILGSSAKPEMYDEPFDPVHYAGAVAHEVAHAVMQHNLATELISPAPQEYLAHAAQLAALPEARRQKIIARMNVGPWEPGDAISDIYMAMQPGKFAVKSYLHLTGMKHPDAFVRILLNANWFYVYVPNDAVGQNH